MPSILSKTNYRFANAAISGSVLILVIVLTLVLYGLAQGYSLYLFAETQYTHQVHDSTIDFLSDLENDGRTVRIRFCMSEEQLQDDPVYRLVWNTAHQLKEKLPCISVETINLMRDPEEVEPYLFRWVENEQTGEKEWVQVATATRQTVIFDGETTHTMQSLSQFFHLDANQRITAYNGEQVMAAAVRYVLTDTHPKAYYTGSHGEVATAPLLNLLTCAGYEVTPIDLMHETPEDEKGILLIATPVYDFVEGAEGVTAEIEKIEDFMARGGLVIACLDPLSSNTTHLKALFARWGIVVEDGIVRDSENAITTDGYTLVASFGEGVEGKGLSELIGEDARVILREASPLTVHLAEGKTTEPLLVSSSASKMYAHSGVVSDEGNFPLSAISIDQKSGGGVLVVASYYLGATDALESDEYGNSNFVLGAIGRYRGVKVPLSREKLRLDHDRLENLTMGEARRYTLLLTTLVPALVVVAGVVVLLRRKNSGGKRQFRLKKGGEAQ